MNQLDRAIRLMNQSVLLVKQSKLDGLSEIAKQRHFEILESMESNIKKLEKISDSQYTTCPDCGSEYRENEPQCPSCGSFNDDAKFAQYE